MTFCFTQFEVAGHDRISRQEIEGMIHIMSEHRDFDSAKAALYAAGFNWKLDGNKFHDIYAYYTKTIGPDTKYGHLAPYLEPHERTENLEYIDLGAGGMSVDQRFINALRLRGIGERHIPKIIGVDFGEEPAFKDPKIDYVKQDPAHPGVVRITGQERADKIIIEAALHHMPADVQLLILREAHRLLKPGGVVVVLEDVALASQVPAHDERGLAARAAALSDEERRQAFSVFDWHANCVVAGNDYVPMPGNYFSEELWTQIFFKAGFEIADSDYLGVYPNKFSNLPHTIFVLKKSHRPWWMDAFHILWGSWLSDIGTGVQLITMATLFVDVFHQPYLVPLAWGAAILGRTLFSYWGGILADHKGKSYYILITASRCIPPLLSGLMIYVHLAQAWHILALSFLDGVGLGFGGAIYYGTLLSSVSAKPRFMGLPFPVNQIKNQLGLAIGSALGAAVIPAWSIHWGYFLNSASYWFYVLAILFLQIPLQSRKAQSLRQQWSEAREGVAILKAMPLIIPLFLMMMITAFLGYPLMSLLPAVLGSAHAEWLGRLATSFYLGSFLATAISLFQEIRHAKGSGNGMRRLQWPLMGLLGMSLIGVDGSINSWWAVLFVASAGFSYNWFILLSSRFVGLFVAAEFRVRAISLQQMLLYGTQVSGALTAYLLARAGYAGKTLFAGGLIALAASLIAANKFGAKSPSLGISHGGFSDPAAASA